MKLARAIRFDKSDLNVFETAAEDAEWALSGTFTFAGIDAASLKGKTKQAFANGFMGLPSFGFTTLVSVATAKPEDVAQIKAHLITHFIEVFGAPDASAAEPAADAEIAFMAELCSEHKTGTLLSIQRELTDQGIQEKYRSLSKADSCSDQKLWTMVDDDK